MDLTLGDLNLRYVMQDAVAEDQIEAVVGERQFEDAALPEFLVG